MVNNSVFQWFQGPIENQPHWIGHPWLNIVYLKPACSNSPPPAPHLKVKMLSPFFVLDCERLSFFPQSHVWLGHVKMQTMQTADCADWGFFFLIYNIIFIYFYHHYLFLTLNFSLLALNRVFLLLSWFPAIFPITPLWKSRVHVNWLMEEQFWCPVATF